MNLYNIRRRTKDCRVKFACTIVCHTLDVYYHAHCFIAYLACCGDMGGIVISCDSEVKKMLDRTQKRVGDGSEREVGGREKGKTGRNRESINLHGQHVTEFLTKSCMFAYKWYCMTMCKCIIVIVNLLAE